MAESSLASSAPTSAPSGCLNSQRSPHMRSACGAFQSEETIQISRAKPRVRSLTLRRATQDGYADSRRLRDFLVALGLPAQQDAVSRKRTASFACRCSRLMRFATLTTSYEFCVPAFAGMTHCFNFHRIVHAAMLTIEVIRCAHHILRVPTPRLPT